MGEPRTLDEIPSQSSSGPITWEPMADSGPTHLTAKIDGMFAHVEHVPSKQTWRYSIYDARYTRRFERREAWNEDTAKARAIEAARVWGAR